MCGIAGFSLAPDEHTNSRKLAKNLLLGIEHRGMDSTGAAWFDRKGKAHIQKLDVPATKFVPNLSVWKKADTVLLHTRFGTGGSPTNPLNNHPIRAGHVIGVHNGFLDDEDRLWDDLGMAHMRRAKVDSEAIFATLAWGWEKFDAKSHTDLLEEVHGKLAVGFFDLEDPDYPKRLHLARGNMSPVEVMVTAKGSRIFASEKRVLEAVATAAQLDVVDFQSFEEGEYQSWHEGEVHGLQSWNPPHFGWTTSSWNTYQKTQGNTPKGKPSGVIPVSRSWAEGVGTDGAKYCDLVDDRVHHVTRDEDNVIHIDPVNDDEEEETVWSWLMDLLDPAQPVAEVNWDYDMSRQSDKADYRIELEGEGLTFEDIEQTLSDMGAYLAVGDWVVTDVGADRVVGQIADIPDSFPAGEFIVRVLIPKKSGPPVSGSTAALVAKEGWELDKVPDRQAASLDSYYEGV